ncbi:ROK family transcriptional regulator [Pseudarthrobacter sp. MDT3-28]|uniref:ROK family transcriptional regulator n=1 Tax=Pseudarthrobacter raffinosi TaxID=2953651 RepID=UPI00208DE8D9|nr:ROK family transcriptional regulator [Pseudarthrobacter sp. MDT3-28]MCO4239243.1 ROK family transcriptional regulator [Pseudarthrobacter sp. MDT3-28]
MTEITPRRLKGRSYAETRSAVLDLIRSSESISRVDLAQQSSLTEVTISKIVKELLAEGIVIPAGQGRSTGGKRPTLLKLNTGVLYAVGVALDVPTIVIVLCGLSGTLIERVDIPGMGVEPPPIVVARVAEAVSQLLERRGLQPSSIMGVGVASSGRRRGPLGWGADPTIAKNWEQFDTAAELELQCRIPVVVENDANCVALGTFWSRGTTAARDFMTVYMAQGIGAGIVINGAVFRGASDNAGELGHVVVEPDGVECWCGASGCLETVGTPRGIVRQVQADPKLAALFGVGDAPNEAVIYKNVLEGLSKGMPQAEALITRSVDRVSSVLLGLANVLDLDWIQLTGPGFAAEGKRYAKQLRKLTDNASFTRGVHTVTVELGGTGPDVAALGAASVVLHGSLTPHHQNVRN